MHTHHTSHITPWHHHTHIPHSALTTLGPCHPSPSPVLDPFKHSLNYWKTDDFFLLDLQEERKWKLMTKMNHCHWIVFFVTTWCVCEVFRPEPPSHHPHQHTARAWGEADIWPAFGDAQDNTRVKKNGILVLCGTPNFPDVQSKLMHI